MYSTSSVPSRTLIAASREKDKDLARAESQCSQPDRQPWTTRLWNALLPPKKGHRACEERTCPSSTGTTIENYPLGRPRFAALIASHESFSFCRRFSYLRARLLLEKQDHLSLLEKKLSDIDVAESNMLHLSSSRLDRNEKRKEVTKEIDRALVDYDSFIQRSSQILRASPPQSRDVQNLQNWIEGNQCLARHQTAYVSHINRRQELASLASPADGGLSQVAIWITSFLTRVCSRYYQQKCSDVSSDPRVFIYSSAFLEHLARAFIAVLVITYLLVPVVICNTFANMSQRLIVIIISTAVFIMTLAGLMRARTVDLFIAGSAYATVLTVFVTNTN